MVKSFRIYNRWSKKVLRYGRVRLKHDGFAKEESVGQTITDSSIDKYDFGSALSAYDKAEQTSLNIIPGAQSCIIERNRKNKGWVFTHDLFGGVEKDTKVLMQFQR